MEFGGSRLEGEGGRLVAVSSRLDIGGRILEVWHYRLDMEAGGSGCWGEEDRYWGLNVEKWMLGTASWMLGAGCWEMDAWS